MTNKGKPIMTVTLDLDMCRSELKSGRALDSTDNPVHVAIKSLRKFLVNPDELTDEKDIEFATKLAAARQCQVVHHACGTCDNPMLPDDWSLVEYYCGSGGSEPDKTSCLPC